MAIAEGEGRNAVWLATLDFDVEMWDASKVGLEKAKRLATSRNVSLQTKQIDLNEAVWSQDTYDLVICIFGHFPPYVREKVLAGIQKITTTWWRIPDRSVLYKSTRIRNRWTKKPLTSLH